MNKILLSLAVLILFPLFMAAKDLTFSFGETPKELSIRNGLNVIYKPGHTSGTKVTVSGPDDKVGNVKVELTGKSLRLHVPKKENCNGQHLAENVTVTVESGVIPTCKASSGADIRCSSTIDYGNATAVFDASSGADIKFGSIICTNLNCEASSGSDLIIANVNCDKASLDSSSGADIKIGKLTSVVISLEASSGSDIKIGHIHAGTLTAKASSAADISLKAGDITTAILEATSGSDIDARSVSIGNYNIEQSSCGKVKTHKNSK